MNLVIFTTTFPYEGGEQFLETEIEFLSKEFDKIVIVPAKANGKIRDTPKNVIIDNYTSKMDRSIFNRVKNLFDRNFILNLTLNHSQNRYLAIRMVYINRYLKWLKNFDKRYYNINFKNTIFYSYWFDSATIALSIEKRKNRLIKFVTRTHGGDLYESEHNFKYFPMRRDVLINIDRVFPISLKGKKHLLKKYKPISRKIIVSRLGIKPHGFKSIPSDDNILRVVSCSSLIEIKRVHIIIEALSLLVDKNIKVLWTHIGDGILKEDLEKKSKEKLTKNIKYRFLGKLSNSDVYKFYRENRVDLFINF
jgi:glycosyltransferase involved in cell wall biosynthesis